MATITTTTPNERTTKPLTSPSYAIPADTEMSVTVYLGKTAQDATYEQTEQFAREHNLSVIETSTDKCTIQLHGTVADMQAAFGVHMEHGRDPKTGFQVRTVTGHPRVPAAIAPHVTAVLGFDTRPIAKPHFRLWPFGHPHPHQNDTAAPEARALPLTAPQVAKAYKFPTDVTGKGAIIAMIELGGGYTLKDLKLYFNGLNIPEPEVLPVGVLGATNSPGSDADGEVLLDIEVAGAVAPGAKYRVYFAPNTDQGFVNALLQAATATEDKPHVISISWGSAEDEWTAQARNAMNQALQICAEAGISIFVASGDNGAQDSEPVGLHADFPASSPYATGCGGTRLILNTDGTIHSQTVWDDSATQEGSTGGGFSKFFPVPDYQQHIKSITAKGKRGVPDVAGPADPETGYRIVIDGQQNVVGGTSSVAPLWAAYIALLIEKRGGKPLGLINPALYKASSSCYWDVRSGNNDYTDTEGFAAAKGWDACTGLGTPIGDRLAKILVGA